MPLVRRPPPQAIPSLASVIRSLPKGGRSSSPRLAPTMPQIKNPTPEPIAITAKILAKRRPTPGLTTPQISSPAPRIATCEGPNHLCVVRNQANRPAPIAVATTAKFFAARLSRLKLQRPQIRKPTARLSNRKGKYGSTFLTFLLGGVELLRENYHGWMASVKESEGRNEFGAGGSRDGVLPKPRRPPTPKDEPP
jgi:hypothetical protein